MAAVDDVKNLDGQGLYKSDPGMMTLTSRRKVNPLTAVADDINILDIGRSLSRQCRYNGHVGGFYSVARHSLWVSEHLEDKGYHQKLQLTGLLHDAAEAYMGDMIRPLKYGEVGSAYLTAEARLESEIAKHYDIPHPWPEAVMAADNWVLLERELGGEEARWNWNSTPDEDEHDFLERFAKLAGG
jgi:hypothetical protein